MAHSLSTHQIARLVGSQAFSRGERYARDGHVSEQSWSGGGTLLYGRVSGTRARAYVVAVSLTLNEAGTAEQASGVCTCPMKSNCKHVAALLIASQAEPVHQAKPAKQNRTVGERRTPTFQLAPPSTPTPTTTPPPPTWQRKSVV